MGVGGEADEKQDGSVVLQSCVLGSGALQLTFLVCLLCLALFDTHWGGQSKAKSKEQYAGHPEMVLFPVLPLTSHETFYSHVNILQHDEKRGWVRWPLRSSVAKFSLGSGPGVRPQPLTSFSPLLGH